MYGNLALAVAALLLSPTETPRPSLRPATGPDDEPPQLRVWVDSDDPYQQGAPARVFFRSHSDAYLTILRIDTEGRVRVLFPVEPWEDNYSRGGKTFEVLGRTDDAAFRVDDAPGVGYIFAIASPDPFVYDEYTRGDHWDYRTISDGRVRGDPYVAVTELADRIAPEGDYDYDVAEYYVGRHYDYPRFVCYDCHGYAAHANWDPYDSFCSRYRVVIYDDPYYYPYRRYGSRTVVAARPHHPGPRFVFKDYDGRDDYVTRVAQRPRDDVPSDDRTSADAQTRRQLVTPMAPRERMQPDNGSPTIERQQRSTPTRIKPDAVEPPRTEPKQAPRIKPDEKSRKVEPRREPANDRKREPVRAKPPPRSTGEPELRRRKPS